MCPKCDEDCQSGCEAVSMKQELKNADEYSSTCPRSCSQLSTVSAMSESSAPNCVYRRRKLRKNSMALFAAQASANTKASSCCLSAVSSEAPLAAATDNETKVVRAPDTLPLLCTTDPLALKSGTVIGYSTGEEHGSDEAPNNGMRRTMEFSSVNDNCSSSKSNIDGSATMKIDVDDAGECSSSDAFLMEVTGDDISEKEFCISILRSQGLLGDMCPLRASSSEGAEVGTDGRCSRSCKVCGRSEITLNMLICDNCEEAYHVACCNHQVKKISIDEWFCQSCLKKKRKILDETTIKKSPSISSEPGSSYRKLTLKGDAGPIAFMLRDTEPYTTGVRIGKAFQAEVPDWSGPVSNDADIIGEPVEMDSLESIHLHGLKSNKDSRVSSIGNWLQCRDVIDGVGEGVDGTICGKWRRAPLFEVQTDDWDCSRAVLWDPAHADCAIPQELETDQILKQLKYIEVLRPRLAAKRRKIDRSERSGSQDPKEDARNTQTSS